MQQVLQNKVGQVMKLGGLVISAAVFVFGLALPAHAATSTLLPTDTGNYNSWNLTGTSTKSQAVATDDSNTSHISETSDNQVQTFIVANAGLPTGTTINSVTFHVVASGTNSGIQLRLEKGTGSGSQNDSATASLTNAYAGFSRVDTVNPFTGSAWTLAEVNSWTVRFGVQYVDQGGNDVARVTHIYVVVDYTLPDTTAPVLTEVTPVTTPTSNTTPTYIFNSTEAGTIIYGGDCSSVTTNVLAGDNMVTFDTLSADVHSNCTIQVADFSANTSTALAVSSFTIDTEAPVIAFGDLVTAEATSSAGAYVDYTVPTATDNVDPAVVVTCTPESGTLFELGSTNVDCFATDAAGNVATPVGFTVRVEDTTPPVIDSPAHPAVEATGPDGAVVTYTAPNAVDAVDGTFTSTCLPASGTLFPLGTTVVTCNATDASDNEAASVEVHVLVRDTTAPVITLNGSNIISLFIGDTYNELGATATDIVDGDVTTTNNIIITGSVNTSVPGTNVLTYNVTDAAGNDADWVQRFVNVSDNTGPVINLIADMTVEATSAINTVVDYGTITATDDVDGTFDIPAVSCLPASGATFPIGTTVVNCNATDSSGNVGFGLALSVTVQDTTAPVIVITPDSQTVEAVSIDGATASFDVSVTDAVDTGVSFSLVCSATSGAMFQIGTTVVTCTAHDEMGNYTTSTAEIVVRDSFPPLPFAVPDQTFEATGFLTSPVLALPAISDLIDPAATLTYAPSSSFPLGTTAVTWTASDFSGNTTVVTSNVIIIDTTAPVITLHGDSTITLTVGDSYVEQGASVSDNHDTEMPAPTVGGDVVNTSVAGTYTVTYDAQDISGNSAVQQVRTVVVNAVASSGGTSGGGSSFVEPTPPSFGDQPVTVGGGLGNTSTVQLIFDVQNASWMAISETPDFSNVSWVPYTTSTTFTLSASNTESKLYIKFRRANGGETKVQEVTVLPNSPSTLIQAVLGVRITRLGELLAKLKFGNRGLEVVELQELLKEAGFFPAKQAATGYYGPITLAAANKALVASKAVLGVKIARVDELVAKLKVGNRGSEVVELQTLLKQAGYFPAAQTATGYYGPITNASVKKYLAAVK